MSLRAEHIPEGDRAFRRRVVGNAECVQARLQLWRQAAGSGQARKIALDVSHEHRHANGRKAFGEQLQRDRLAGTGGAGDQTVPVGQGWQQGQIDIFVSGNEQRGNHDRLRKVVAGRDDGKC
ncbi:MAG: hypothetical protein CAPSK01_004837 [Candidatus Accumulibacter vicinus]|uniref:Uncharacterized protein n=1 Tax=Candidatus Accumulibacter vicinus TaxID=2954382 RepID=A0A084XU51_9PROT|nr:MAG: hypothetical protein CAPSK01_004837 [Candidatus Accumulibacter vicinus]